ncbi:hypothetical protein PUNSTDRAFT_133947 [Punctularia strigosozonata HHB-11173 SS5]|uniref:uncharacterized protein n=1 Tax=Punctularia strigosozonata (strain HHB-11173) TaxID=741275 RepID=UPI0004417F59|nr:uncharacterized protein PUNSTDRAFT_133947 [Punctularia strigosozonata HHB-11173 SS5]EIN08766.1 hypothetical protein PUNSTDRAFT_133947 [Punctularia strigosozonata HHB-11173 SS5]
MATTTAADEYTDQLQERQQQHTKLSSSTPTDLPPDGSPPPSFDTHGPSSSSSSSSDSTSTSTSTRTPASAPNSVWGAESRPRPRWPSLNTDVQIWDMQCPAEVSPRRRAGKRLPSS